MQFDVFVNPIVAARRGYPYVVVMQSDFAHGERDQIVAPLVPRKAVPAITGHLTPIVEIEATEYVVAVQAMAGVRRRDLGERTASLAAARSELLNAIDYLFFGM